MKLTHTQFLTGAGITEAALLMTAFFLGWLMDFKPTQDLWWDWVDLGYGLLAAVPLLLILAAVLLIPGAGVRRIREFMRDTLGPPLARCRLIDLALLALIAGLCEEVLFRGFLFGYIWQYNRGLAIVVCNLAFGLAHLVTPLYALLAVLAGLYLTALLAVDPSPNLLVPIAAHAAYDFIAFQVVVRDFKKKRQDSQNVR